MSRERMCGVARVEEGFGFFGKGFISNPVGFCRGFVPAEGITEWKGADFTLERYFLIESRLLENDPAKKSSFFFCFLFPMYDNIVETREGWL